MYIESYQWQIGLERILILPLAPCGFDTPYLSLPPLEIATMIPCTWGLSVDNAGQGRGDDSADSHALGAAVKTTHVPKKNLKVLIHRKMGAQDGVTQRHQATT